MDRGVVELARKALSMLDASLLEVRELVMHYEDSQASLLETVNAALLMAGTLQGDGKPAYHPVRLAVLVTEAIADVDQKARARGIGFRPELEGPDLATGNMDLIFEVISTILSAAILIARKGSLVPVRLSSADGRIELQIRLHGSKPRESGLASLFEGSTRSHSSGAGRDLGLAIPLAAKLTSAM